MCSEPDVAGCGPSSPELKANVANFLARADEIARHPLAGQHSTFEIRFQRHPTNGEVMATGFDMQARPADDWLAMAVRMRPIIFLEADDISIPRLTGQIEREHTLLRGRLKEFRARLAAWKRNAFVYPGNFGGARLPLSEGEVRYRKSRSGRPVLPPERHSRA